MKGTVIQRLKFIANNENLVLPRAKQTLNYHQWYLLDLSLSLWQWQHGVAQTEAQIKDNTTTLFLICLFHLAYASLNMFLSSFSTGRSLFLSSFAARGLLLNTFRSLVSSLQGWKKNNSEEDWKENCYQIGNNVGVVVSGREDERSGSLQSLERLVSTGKNCWQ